MPVIDHAMRVTLDSHDAIFLCKATGQHGRKFCLYLQAEKENALKLIKAYEDKALIHFNEYGRILWLGYFDEPPAAIHRRILENA